MTQSHLSKWLKFIIFCIALFGLFVCFWGIPEIGKSVVKANPEFDYCYYPWLILLWITAIPCYIALAYSWKIAGSIGQDKTFTAENAKLFKKISFLAVVDSVFFLLMNAVFLFLNMNHPGIFLISVCISFAGISVSVMCSGLSYLVYRAAALQEQSDLTI